MLKHFLNCSPLATFGCALGFTNCCLQNLGRSCGLLYVFFFVTFAQHHHLIAAVQKK